MRQEPLQVAEPAVSGAIQWPPAGARVAPRRGRPINRVGQWLGGHAERFYLLYVMLIMSGAGWSPPDPTALEALAAEGSLTDSIVTLAYLVAILLIVFRAGGVVRAALAHPWTLAMLALIAASTLWSQTPDVTVRRAVGVVATCGIGWYLVARYPPREIIRLVAIVLVFTALLSLLHGVVNPASVILPLEGTWRGVYENKNVFARAMALSGLLCLVLLLEPGRWRWLLWAGLALSCAMVAMSQSATGGIILIALVILVRFSSSLRLRATILVPLGIATLLLIAGGVYWLQFHAAELAAGIGKDTTFTGRTDLWSVAIMMIERHPWLGYGWGGFWRGFIGDSGQLWGAVGWKAPHAHNGFIDLTLDLGLVGLVVFVAGLATAIAAAVARARTARSVSAVAPLALLAFVIVYNLTESSVFRHNTLFLILYVVATSVACGGSERARGRTAPE